MKNTENEDGVTNIDILNNFYHIRKLISASVDLVDGRDLTNVGDALVEALADIRNATYLLKKATREK